VAVEAVEGRLKAKWLAIKETGREEEEVCLFWEIWVMNSVS
jgi:hypothetical protein